MPQTLQRSTRVFGAQKIIPALIRRLHEIAEGRPDGIRFRYVVMKCILTKLIIMRSRVNISWNPEPFEMEDSPEALGFFEEIRQAFVDSPLMPQEQREEILNFLLRTIQAEIA